MADHVEGPPRDRAATVLLAVAGAACLGGGAYALALCAGVVAGTLFFLGLGGFVLAAFEPRLRGQLKLGPRGMTIPLGTTPTARALPVDATAQITNADAARFVSLTKDLELLLRGEPLAFGIIDLGTGWLDSRLFVLAALLRRARGARSLVFLDSHSGESSYLGIADIQAVRWALAKSRPELEAAFVAAQARAMYGWWPLSEAPGELPWSIAIGTQAPTRPEQVTGVGATTIGSLSGNLEPHFVMGQVLHDCLRAFRIFPTTPDEAATMDTSNPPAGWVRLRTESKEIYWERTGRIDRKRLGDLLGDALVTTAVRETAAGAVKLDEVLRWGGSVVPVVDQRDRFVKGIDREATAATIGAKPKPPKAKARNLKGHAVS